MKNRKPINHIRRKKKKIQEHPTKYSAQQSNRGKLDHKQNHPESGSKFYRRSPPKNRSMNATISNDSLVPWMVPQKRRGESRTNPTRNIPPPPPLPTPDSRIAPRIKNPIPPSQNHPRSESPPPTNHTESNPPASAHRNDEPKSKAEGRFAHHTESTRASTAPRPRPGGGAAAAPPPPPAASPAAAETTTTTTRAR